MDFLSYLKELSGKTVKSYARKAADDADTADAVKMALTYKGKKLSKLSKETMGVMNDRIRKRQAGLLWARRLYGSTTR